jgi:hypothetical protein
MLVFEHGIQVVITGVGVCFCSHGATAEQDVGRK